jgi:predicted nucleic-acid-binding Zn-ribbon protein
LKNGICPRCHHTQVYSSSRLRAETGNASFIPLSFLRSIALDNYVCANCGYVESYVSEPEMLSRIADIWPHVEPPHGKNYKHLPKNQA